MIHPLDKLTFCPSCGSKHFENETPKSKKCRNCGFEMFQNAAAAVAAFIRNDKGELLVTERNCDPGKGMLDLPGGFSDIGETSEETVVREIKEETHLEITEATYLFSLPNIYLYSGLRVPTLDFFYECKVKDISRLKAADDVSSCQWVKPEDIHTELFALRSIRHGLTKYLEQAK